MAQEQKDQIMIQKSLSGAVEPREQHELDQIGQHCSARNKGEAIQMPPLHEALVEVHREYEKANRATKDMAELYKKALAASEVLNDKCTRTQGEKEELSKKFRQTEEKLRKAEEELLIHQQSARLFDSKQELNQRLQEAEASTRSAIGWAEEAETRVKKIEERLLLVKTEIAKWLEAKDVAIQQPKRQLAQQQEEKRQQEEQILELEEYVRIQDDYFSDHMAKSELKTIVAQEVHEEDN